MLKYSKERKLKKLHKKIRVYNLELDRNGETYL